MRLIHSIPRRRIRGLTAIILLVGICFFLPLVSFAVTLVDTDIAADTTWTKAGSPYEVTFGIFVHEGVTLTIDPGVVVRFRQAEWLWVNGTIRAVGTAAEPIVFTGTGASPGWWQALAIEGTGPNILTGSVLDYVTIENGGSYGGGLYIFNAAPVVRHSIIKNNLYDGVYGGATASANIADTVFQHNQGNAVNFIDAGAPFTLVRLTATGNGFNGIRLGTHRLFGTHTWTNPGLPYRVEGWVEVAENGNLRVDPGVMVRFAQNTSFNVYGTIQAVGTPSQPITFTGTNPIPGWWQGMTVEGSGGVTNRGSNLEFVTIEYGGSTAANLYLNDAQVRLRHCILRYSTGDGLSSNWDAGTVIENGQITQNAGYGIRNYNTGLILAMNNWWGDPSGPAHDPCNANGQGSRVSSGVAFRPFLTSPTQVPGPVDPSDTALLTIQPLRWYAPADGVTRVWVKLGLHDGRGQPLPGRTVTLNSSLGQVTSGGITDFQGQTFAFLTSTTAGDALLTPGLSGETQCEIPRAATAKVTFTAAGDDPLLPGAQAPYLHEGIEVTPLPVTRGVPTRLKAALSNPNDFPILVDASFNFAQLGIGLAFGPVGQVQDWRIEAKASRTIDIPWTPIVSGNYCVQLQYAARQADGPLLGAWSASGSSMSNLSVQSGPLGSSSSTPGDPNADPADPKSQEKPGEKPTIEKAKKGIDTIRKGKTVVEGLTSPGKVPGMAIPNFLFGKILNFNFDTWSQASQALGGDPPRQDYTTIAMSPRIPFTPVQAGGDMTAGRAAAANALMEGAMDLTSKYRAARLSLERYSGAAEAQDLAWASQQAAALVYYKKESGKAMATVADRLTALIQQIQSEGIADITVSAAALSAYQDRLRTQGWTAEEKQAAYSVGLADEDLALILQEHLAADPSLMAGSVLASLNETAATLRELGTVLANPGNFPPSGEGLTQSAPNNLVRIFTARTPIQVGNPLGQTALVELRARPVNLPPDWMVSVSPSRATLAPGQTITAEVQLTPGMAVPQGLQTRVAVEGFVDTALIGGVVVDVLVPQALFFNGKLRLYLPLLLKVP